jgi:acyl-coenzyme A synthetase/AMP-(fatty) acid ligase
VKGHLAHYEDPRDIDILLEIPKTIVKIRRRALEDRER